MYCLDVETPIRDFSKPYIPTADRDKASWVSEYSDDIFRTLRESELHAKTVYFRSRQCDFHRPQLLDLLRFATENYNLRRTTFHLATYLLDRFMDSYTIRLDKLNLTVLSCLLLAAKIEEADINLPKFSDLCSLVPETYTLQEYKNVELKLLNTINFSLIRPTVATFAEYFLNGFITLEDYHQYMRNWHEHGGGQHFNFTATSCYCCPGQTPWLQSTPPILTWYSSYEDMVNQLSKMLMSIVDVSLNYLKFANARPSIIASACIAAVRQMQNIRPIWTPYLIKLTEYTEDVIAPFVDALVVLWKMNTIASSPQLPQSQRNTVLCDSPDSGVVLNNDTKSESELELEDENVDDAALETKTCLAKDNDSDDNAADDDEYCCYEYPLLAKRMRLF